MIIKYLHLKGFTSYIDSEINFDTNENFIATITGQNGFGKSSILEGITTALFYRARGTDNRGSGMDHLINNESDNFEITFIFIMDNNEYKIIRRKYKEGKHELEFYINDISQTEKINETQEKINKVIKMNYETFLDTICIGQGLSGNFMKKKPNERKDVFIEILNLNQYEILEKYTKENKKSVMLELDKLNNELNVLSNTLENENDLLNKFDDNNNIIKDNNMRLKDLKEKNKKQQEEKLQYELLKKQNEQIVKQKKSIQEQIKLNENKLNDLKNKFLNYKTKINNINNKLNDFEIELNNILIDEITNFDQLKNDLLIKKDEIDNNIQNINNLITNEETKINIFSNDFNKYKKEYNNFENYDKAICDFCGNEITSEHKYNHLSLLKEKMDNKEKLINDIKNNISKNKITLSDLKTNQQNLKTEILKLDNSIKLNNENINHKNRIKNSIENTKNEIILYQDSIDEIKSNKKIFEDILFNLNKQLNDFVIEDIPIKIFNDDFEKSIKDLENITLKLSNDNAIYKNKLDDINTNKKEIKKLNKKIKELEVTIEDYNNIIEAFGKKGIQANIIANVLPEIENETNIILDILFNNETTIEFITQKDDTKSKAKSSANLETLDIVIHDKDKDRIYETYSGGEKFKIDLALHIGLAKFLAKRAKANIEFFMIDEGLGSQDDEGKDNFIIAINKLSAIFKQIFIITHIEELKESFDKKIIISKDPLNGSKINLI